MKKISHNKKNKNKLNNKRKAIARKQKKDHLEKYLKLNLKSEVGKDTSTLITSTKSDVGKTSKKSNLKSKLIFLTSFIIQVVIGFTGFLTGGFLIAMKIPFWVNLLTKN